MLSSCHPLSGFIVIFSAATQAEPPPYFQPVAFSRIGAIQHAADDDSAIDKNFWGPEAGGNHDECTWRATEKMRKINDAIEMRGNSRLRKPMSCAQGEGRPGLDLRATPR